MNMRKKRVKKKMNLRKMERKKELLLE